MSHIVTISTEVRDATAVRAACRRLNLPQPVEGETKLFSGTVSGLAVQLPDWRYPICCELPTGQVRFDNYENRWGDRKHLDAFLQSYAVEKAKIESRHRGHSVTEQTLPNGSVKLTIQVNGGAA